MSRWYKINPKVFSTILHFQLNYHVQLVFNKTKNKRVVVDAKFT